MSIADQIWLGLSMAVLLFGVVMWCIDRRRAKSYDEYMRKYREYKASVEHESRKQL